MRINKTQIFGFEMAIEGMRNPRESYDLIDSDYFNMKALEYLLSGGSDTKWGKDRFVVERNGFVIYVPEGAILGERDLSLIKSLVGAGEPHCKFLRQIGIWVEIEMARCAWVDWDTYKVATVRNSCSTRHTPKIRPFQKEDFEAGYISDEALQELNEKREEWLEGDKFALVEMKRMLPEGYLQRAHYTMNYSTALNILRQRFDHPLPEFNALEKGSLGQWLLSLPYMQDLLEAAMEGFIRRAEVVKKRLERFREMKANGVF